MVALWFVLVCAMFGAYVVLDGYDLGAGIVSPFVGKTEKARAAILETILPFWDGNEVFLVAGGASLYLAFPRIFPDYMSGFYLPVMFVLWLLMLRGLGIEMRHKLDHPLWNQLWDGGFFLSSLLLVFFFGAALGNVVRGVSLDVHGEFFAPLWTDFGVGDDVGILDWYTVLVGVTAVVTIARHGCLRLGVRVEEAELRGRADVLAERLAAPMVALVLVASIATFAIQPNVAATLRVRPYFAVAGVVAAAGLATSVWAGRQRRSELAFRSSSAAVAGLFAAACVAVYPYGVLARVPERSILAADGAASAYGLGVALVWWIPGMTLVLAYTLFAHRRWLRRPVLSATEHAEGR